MAKHVKTGWLAGWLLRHRVNIREMEFQFNLPEKLSVTGFNLSIENYITV